MLLKTRYIDSFAKNIILVFAGVSLVNFLNLLYQLLVAHRLSLAEFAAFNSLLAIFTVISAPLGTLQMAVAKYCAQFQAQGNIQKVKLLLSVFFRKALFLAGVTLLVFGFFSSGITRALGIPSLYSGYILAALLALAWLSPVLSGGIQGLELFRWLTGSLVLSSLLKLGLAVIFVWSGYGIAGALGALLVAGLFGIFICYLPLRNYLRADASAENIKYREILLFLLPVALSSFCFMALANFDMVLVKYYFTAEESGAYSLAQMLGKIFLFLPASISVVMFPRASALNAKNMETATTLKRSLFYVSGLCVSAYIFYSLFPSFTLRVLTGKASSYAITLGRLFGISMSLFTLTFVFISYFLSIKEFRFIKYLVASCLLQYLAIAFFHPSLFSVQFILCVNALLLFCVNLILSCRQNALAGHFPLNNRK